MNIYSYRNPCLSFDLQRVNCLFDFPKLFTDCYNSYLSKKKTAKKFNVFCFLERLVVSNVENRPLLLFELDAVDEDEDDNDKVIKASMKFELFTNNKKNGAATDFGFFLRSVETKCFVRIALDGFLVADAKTCEQSTEFGFEPRLATSLIVSFHFNILF